MKTLIVCSSKYGSTFEIGRWLAERLGEDCLVDKAESMLDPADSDIVILGSGIYSHHVLPSVQKYVNRFKDALKGKKTVVFGVAMDTEGLKGFYKMLYGQEIPIPYKTRMDKNEVWAFAEKILERIERPI